MGGFVTGGILNIRSGPQSAFKNACIGGLMLAIIEGVGVALNVYMYRQQQIMQEAMMAEEKKKIEKMRRI